jgi:hypothetical protein
MRVAGEIQQSICEVYSTKAVHQASPITFKSTAFVLFLPFFSLPFLRLIFLLEFRRASGLAVCLFIDVLHCCPPCFGRVLVQFKFVFIKGVQRAIFLWMCSAMELTSTACQGGDRKQSCIDLNASMQSSPLGSASDLTKQEKAFLNSMPQVP